MNPSVMLVEDDPAVQQLLKEGLAEGGYEVLAADDGLAALKLLEWNRPDVIIADIMMPRLDGMTFVKAIRGRKDTRPIPVIFLTAKADPKTMIAGINLGAKYYVTKPFRMPELLEKIEKALGRG